MFRVGKFAVTGNLRLNAAPPLSLRKAELCDGCRRVSAFQPCAIAPPISFFFAFLILLCTTSLSALSIPALTVDSQIITGLQGNLGIEIMPKFYDDDSHLCGSHRFRHGD